MITLQVTTSQQIEMNQLLLDFGERHDMTVAEVAYCAVVALTHQGAQIILQEGQNVHGA